MTFNNNFDIWHRFDTLFKWNEPPISPLKRTLYNKDTIQLQPMLAKLFLIIKKKSSTIIIFWLLLKHSELDHIWIWCLPSNGKKILHAENFKRRQTSRRTKQWGQSLFEVGSKIYAPLDSTKYFLGPLFFYWVKSKTSSFCSFVLCATVCQNTSLPEIFGHLHTTISTNHKILD